MTVEEFAQVLLGQTKARLAALHPLPQHEWERVQVIPGPKYTKVDIGPEHNMSGKYMVENATGVIYGIKGYGKVHKGHVYGTLATVDQWYWGGYTGERVERGEDESLCGLPCPCEPAFPSTWYAGCCTRPTGHTERYPGLPHTASGCCYYTTEQSEARHGS